MISEVWELIGCAVGVSKMVRTSILIHLGFRHLWNGKKKCQCTESNIFLEINLKKILAVINATYAVAKRKPEKIRLAGIRTLTSVVPVQRSNQLS